MKGLSGEDDGWVHWIVRFNQFSKGCEDEVLRGFLVRV